MENTNKVTEQQEQVQQVKSDDIEQIDLDVELVERFLTTTEAGKKILQPKLDKHFSRGLETWKTNNLEAIISKEIEARNPTDPVQRELMETKKQLEQMEAQTKAIKMLEQHHIPSDLAGVFKNATPEELEAFVSLYNSSVIKEVKRRLAENGGTPKRPIQQPITKEEWLKLPYSERTAVFLKDPTIITR